MGEEVKYRKWQRGITFKKNGSKFTQLVKTRGHDFVLNYVTSVLVLVLGGSFFLGHLYLYIISIFYRRKVGNILCRI